MDSHIKAIEAIGKEIDADLEGALEELYALFPGLIEDLNAIAALPDELDEMAKDTGYHPEYRKGLAVASYKLKSILRLKAVTEKE